MSHQKLHKTVQNGLSILNLNFSEIAFLVEAESKQEPQTLILKAIDELLYSWRIETSVIDESNIPNLYSNISF